MKTVALVMMVAIVGHNHPAHFLMMLGHVVPGVPDGRIAGASMCGDAFRRDGCKRLNRQAQCQQHDDEQFAPIGHGCEV